MMTQWQFLLQKEGDQDGLPLEAPNVEILEGRYTLMAQVQVPGAEVEVQIRHEYELDGLCQDVVQRRRQHSDFDGYLELIPLTYLPPGLWEVQCRLIGDGGEPLRCAPLKLKLQVLAQDFELLSDWSVPEALPPVSPTPVANKPITPAPVPISVVLPPNLKDIPQAPLCLSDKLRLPPLIYRPEAEASVAVAPQLPDFLSAVDRQWQETHPTDTTEPHLAFLRCVAQRSDRQRIYAAFAPLARRQRFFNTLKALAVPDAETLD